MRKTSLLATWLLISSLGACAHNQSASTNQQSLTLATPPASSAMAEAGVIMPPLGYLNLCIRSPEECSSDTRQSDLKAELTFQRWAELNDINRSVNSSVRYVTDAALYEMNEFWTIPNGRGDCEDYALLKRKLLLARGWPAETLLLSVALDRDNLQHAVLIVATDKGDFVLDNQQSAVLAWSDTGYTWEKRQTAANPNIWVALTGDAVNPAPFEAPLLMPTIIASAEQQSPTAQVPTASNAKSTRQSNEGLILTASITEALPASIPLPRMRPAVKENRVAIADRTTLGEAATVIDSIENLRQETDA